LRIVCRASPHYPTLATPVNLLTWLTEDFLPWWYKYYPALYRNFRGSRRRSAVVKIWNLRGVILSRSYQFVDGRRHIWKGPTFAEARKKDHEHDNRIKCAHLSQLTPGD